MLNWKRHAFLKPPTDEAIARMEPAELLDLHEQYHRAIEAANEDPLRYGFQLEPWADADKLLDQWDELLIWGGNRSSKTTYVVSMISMVSCDVALGQHPLWDKGSQNQILPSSSVPFWWDFE